jgi:hypothetical protein
MRLGILGIDPGLNGAFAVPQGEDEHAPARDGAGARAGVWCDRS